MRSIKRGEPKRPRIAFITAEYSWIQAQLQTKYDLTPTRDSQDIYLDAKCS